jgi:hypothetical protein
MTMLFRKSTLTSSRDLSEDESYHSDEVEEKATKKTNPQKRGWITRKENLKGSVDIEEVLVSYTC